VQGFSGISTKMTELWNLSCGYPLCFNVEKPVAQQIINLVPKAPQLNINPSTAMNMEAHYSNLLVSDQHNPVWLNGKIGRCNPGLAGG